MTLTMTPATRRLVEAALLEKGARYVNRVSDTSVRESLSATLAARTAATRRMEGVAKTSAELAALLLQYPTGYLADIASAFEYTKWAKGVAVTFRRRVNVIGFKPSDPELRRLAVLHTRLQATAGLYWSTPVADIDLDSTNPHNRFMRKVQSNMLGKWRDLTWAAVDATDIFHTACELAVRESGHPTIGNLYRALNRAYALERRVAFGTRGPGMVSVDDVSELAYNRAFEATIARLETMGRVLLTPEALMSESYVDMAGHPVKSGAHYATRLESHRAVAAAQHDELARERATDAAILKRKLALAARVESQTEALDASAQYGGSIVALLLEGNTLADIAEFFGLTVDTVTRYALSTRDSDVTEESPESVTAEPADIPRRAHWSRNRKPVPPMGHRADKFAGVHRVPADLVTA